MELLQLIIVGTVGGILGLKSPLPAGGIIGALIFVIIFKAIRPVGVIELPPVAMSVAQIFVGIMVGISFTKEFFLQVKSSFIPIVSIVLLLILFTLVLAFLLTKFTDMSAVTAVLSTAPGGIAEVTVLSLLYKANTPLILVFHLARLLAVILLLPFIVRWIAGG